MTQPFVYQIVGYKNRGKTNLVCRLARYWAEEQIPVATIKHDAHGFEFDREGSDTWQHRTAGAVWSAITSGERTAIVREAPSRLAELAALAPEGSIVLAEGFKNEPYPKLVLIRTKEDAELAERLDGVTAAAIWPEMREAAGLSARLGRLEAFDRDDTAGIAGHIAGVLGLGRYASSLPFSSVQRE